MDAAAAAAAARMRTRTTWDEIYHSAKTLSFIAKSGCVHQQRVWCIQWRDLVAKVLSQHQSQDKHAVVVLNSLVLVYYYYFYCSQQITALGGYNKQKLVYRPTSSTVYSLQNKVYSLGLGIKTLRFWDRGGGAVGVAWSWSCLQTAWPCSCIREYGLVHIKFISPWSKFQRDI